jgi:hypothetical protein
MLRSAFGLMVLSLANANTNVVSSESLIIHYENPGQKQVGVFFTGDRDDEDNKVPRELLLQVMSPSESHSHVTFFGHSFAFRTTDMKTRFNVIVGEGENTRPYSVAFENLSVDKDASLEIKDTSGYFWLEGGATVAILTDELHWFTVHSNDHSPVVKFRLHHHVQEEL